MSIVRFEDLLKQADIAMYQSKEAGRNKLHFFDPAMQTVILERARLEADLRHALDEEQFVLYYQVQIGRDRKSQGAEVLVRWRHLERGMVPPDHFIPLAEETGLIMPLGAWVLDTACKQLLAWSADPELAGLTLDDFGTGYSSLAYLSQLPLDQLKIDRSFVMRIEDNENAAAICAATISLAHSLGLKVVAEGVETEAQRYFLETVHDCDGMQGYLFCCPVPLEQFLPCLRKRVS